MAEFAEFQVRDARDRALLVVVVSLFVFHTSLGGAERTMNAAARALHALLSRGPAAARDHDDSTHTPHNSSPLRLSPAIVIAEDGRCASLSLVQSPCFGKLCVGLTPLAPVCKSPSRIQPSPGRAENGKSSLIPCEIYRRLRPAASCLRMPAFSFTFIDFSARRSV